MKTFLILLSKKKGEIQRFLNLYYNSNINTNDLYYKACFDNPLELIEISSCLVDNLDKFKINLWICLDKGIFIFVNESNINNIIKYLYERYPY